VSRVLLLTGTRESAAEILPSLSLLNHTVTIAAAPAEAGAAAMARSAVRSGQDGSAEPDLLLIDARHHLLRARELLSQLAGLGFPLLAVISEGAWAAITAEWGADDVVLHTAGPGEVEARIRLAVGRAAAGRAIAPAAEVRSGELVIDEATYSARISGVALDLTFKEFELLKFLAQHPKRVFTRSQLLQEVWGYDYFGGTRTVDVHVRRLRAKLGSENEALIGTVRNVGYKFVPAKQDSRQKAPATPPDGREGTSARAGKPGPANGRKPRAGAVSTSGDREGG
jgi:DNA-binding response OmpR family regulator